MASFVKPYSESAEKSMKFAQEYDRKTITITKGGKTYNLYDSIQAAREDTEIYPTLEKYGNLQRMENNPNLIYADISEALDLRGLYNQDIRLQEIFENLPTEERKQFNNDFYQFKEFGLKHYEEKAKAEIEEIKKQKEIEFQKANEPQKVQIVNPEDK